MIVIKITQRILFERQIQMGIGVAFVVDENHGETF